MALLCGCDSSTHAGKDAVVEFAATSPDGAVQAKILMEGFGATVADVHSVELSDAQGHLSQVLRADHVKNLKLRWIDNRNLLISMECGRIFDYANFFDVFDKQGKRDIFTINVRLENSTLCAG